jgi:hypothetical protein
VRQPILRALLRRSYTAVAGRRPTFAALANGVDRPLTLGFESLPWQDSHKAALRVVLTGGVIIHCKLAVEDLPHQFWHCPRWDKLRHTSLGSHSQTVFLQMFRPDALTPEIIPSDPVLMDAHIAAEASGSWPTVVTLPNRVWSVGSCLHPADSPLRRATWALVGLGPGGIRTLASAILHGRQTIGSAELSAVIWISHCGY